MTKLDIIIPVWNHLSLTQQCIKTIKAFTWGVDYRILVVDDGSTDQTPNWLQLVSELQVPGIDTVRLEQNQGFNYAVNTGLDNVREDAEYVVVMNNDIQVRGRYWYIYLSEIFGSSKFMHQEVGDNYICHKSLVGATVPASTDTTSRQSVMYNDGDAQLEELGYCIMSCVLFPHHIIKQLGHLDTSLDPNCQADIDYFIRLIDAGYKIVVNRSVLVVHDKGSTIRDHPLHQNEEYKKRNYELLTELRAKHGDERVDKALYYKRYPL